MMQVPTEQRALVSFAQDLVQQCRVSVGTRTAFYRLMNVITETGKVSGEKSLINILYRLLDRIASYMYSPVELKFALDFDNEYPDHFLERARVVAKQVTRQWERKNVDIKFGRGVFESLKYGACVLKQWPQVEGRQERPRYYAKLVMPWQFGVYNESENDLDRQIAMCETTTVTLPEVWRRIWHRPDADKLYNRIRANARRGEAVTEPQSFFHQVLSTSQINTGVGGAIRPMPGGMVQIGADPNYSIMGPQVAVDVVTVHELWVQDQELGDYTTIIFVEPDVIVAPYSKKMNLLGVEEAHPYTLIQANETTNWFWGRSELFDLSEPQQLLSIWADDIRRLFGLQIDKILAFIGDAGITDEVYGQFRNAGWLNLPMGGKVEDLTPKMPPEAMEMLKFLIDTINVLSSLPEIMQGKGEPGVRAGVHASTLLKTASPTLRDRALLIERQCAIAADLTLQLREAKDPSTYWTKAASLEEVNNTSFKLTDLPDDWRVTVDSHSSSPIFSDENTQLLFTLRRQGDVDGEFLLDNLPVPNKEAAKAGLVKRQKAVAAEKQQLLERFPEIGEVLAKKMLTGTRR